MALDKAPGLFCAGEHMDEDNHATMFVRSNQTGFNTENHPVQIDIPHDKHSADITH